VDRRAGPQASPGERRDTVVPNFRHVLCVYPYLRELNEVGFFPPLGLEFIAAVIEPTAKALDIVDLRREKGRTVDFLRPDTDLVCFSVNWDRERDFLREEIRSVPPGIPVLIGGRHATEDPEHWLSEFSNVRAVVRGDGEEAVEEICQGVPFEKILGLSYRSNGEIFHNLNRKSAPVRDDLRPSRHLRRHKYQVKIKGAGTGILIDSVAASRGCPFNCSFCSFNRNPWGEKRPWSARSPESVVDELAEIEAPVVGFTDDLFTFDMDRVERICDLILERGIRKKYLINARLEIARRPDVLRKMEQAGFLLLMLGIESTQDRTLRSMHKGFDTARIREYFDAMRNTSMILHGYFIVGNIGESAEEMLGTAAFARELGLDSVAISTLRVAPHSGLEELVAGTPGYHVAPNGKIYSDECSVQDLRTIRRLIYREFYTTGQILHFVRKGVRNGALRVLPGLLVRLPSIAWRTGVSHHHRARRHKRRKPLPVPAPITVRKGHEGPLLSAGLHKHTPAPPQNAVEAGEGSAKGEERSVEGIGSSPAAQSRQQ
jgi:radical SAM superfamily enzyme YgiQ (UPF0313 family)